MTSPSLLLLLSSLIHAGTVAVPVVNAPARAIVVGSPLGVNKALIGSPFQGGALPQLTPAIKPIVVPGLVPGIVPTALPQLNEAALPQGNVSPEAHLSSVFDGGFFQNTPVSPEQPEDLVTKAQRLFFPDGRRPVVGAGKAPAAEGVPDDGALRAKMELSPLTNPEREAAVVELFKQAGARPEDIVKQDVGRGRNNIMVVKKGRTDRVVIVGAHHDKVSEGRGVIDNWSGTTMMINLYQGLRDLDTEATYIFIGFAREEEGLIGSQRHLESLSREQRGKVDAMVNLDTLAVDGTFSWKNNSTASLLALIKEVSRKSGHSLTEALLHGGDADSSTYKRVGIPAMTLFGASQDVIFDIIHSENDNIAAFSLDHYKNALLLTLELLKTLDSTPVRN
jgi:hypothetical protein